MQNLILQPSQDEHFEATIREGRTAAEMSGYLASADVDALRVCLDAAAAFDRLGVPEGDLALVQAVVYLARATKSNAVYAAHAAAREDVERTEAEPVPMHLRNAVTDLMKEIGYGEGYRYAHDDPAAADEMTCLPPSLKDRDYFQGG